MQKLRENRTIFHENYEETYEELSVKILKKFAENIEKSRKNFKNYAEVTRKSEDFLQK